MVTPIQATQEWCYILKRMDIRDDFDEKYPTWARSIIRYCRDTQIKSTSLQLETKDVDDTNDGKYSMLCNLDCFLELVCFISKCEHVIAIVTACALFPWRPGLW